MDLASQGKDDLFALKTLARLLLKAFTIEGSASSSLICDHDPSDLILKANTSFNITAPMQGNHALNWQDMWRLFDPVAAPYLQREPVCRYQKYVSIHKDILSLPSCLETQTFKEKLSQLWHHISILHPALRSWSWRVIIASWLSTVCRPQPMSMSFAAIDL